MTPYFLLLALYSVVAVAGWARSREPSARNLVPQGLSLAPLLFLAEAQASQVRAVLAGSGSPYLRDFIEVPQLLLLLATCVALPSVFLSKGKTIAKGALGVRVLQAVQILVVSFLGGTLAWLASRMS